MVATEVSINASSKNFFIYGYFAGFNYVQQMYNLQTIK